jgi:hypothetical protein
LNQPLTHDGWQVWDLVGRLGGQMRVAGKAVIGWDMGSALALADALGLNPMVAAELLPELEAVMVRRINEKIGAEDRCAPSWKALAMPGRGASATCPVKRNWPMHGSPLSPRG